MNKTIRQMLIAAVILITIIMAGAETASAANDQSNTRSIENAEITLSASSYPYNGTARKPKPTVVLKGKN